MINCLFFTTMLASFVASFNSLETNRNSNSDFVYMRPMLKRETFKNIGKPLPTDQHQVTIAIKQNNLDKLNDELTDRSMPEGSKYQIWMKQDEVIQLTSNKVATDAVLQWCRDNNLQVVWQNKHQEYFQVSTNVSHWESLLRTEFYKYEDHHPHSIAYYKKPISIHSTIKNSLNKNNLFRAESFSIPSHLSPYIHDIFGVVDPPSVMRKYLERHTDKNNVVDTDSISSTSSGSTTSMKDRKKNELHTEAGTFTITKVISVYKIPPMNSSSKY